MSENLREAVEAQLAEWDERYGLNSRAQEVFKEFGPQTVDVSTVIDVFRAILDAHPVVGVAEQPVIQYVVVTDTGHVFDCNFGGDQFALESAKEVAAGATALAATNGQPDIFRAAVIVEAGK